MLDINLFRQDLDAVAAGLARRGLVLDRAAFEALEGERKDIQTRTQELQGKRNSLSKQIGTAKGKGEDASARCSRARSPRRNEKRAPDILAAVAKSSSPRPSPTSA
jgi:seryl-tRNA synthetase